jgi:RHS repeat-associated protein
MPLIEVPRVCSSKFPTLADGSSVVVPSVAASVPGSMLAAFGAAANHGMVAGWTVPAGLTKRVEASSVAGRSSLHASRPVAAGATGTSTLAFGASAGLTALGVVLNPSPATGALLSYDGHGNTTQIGARVLGWDAADRNVSMTRAGVSSTWIRDATGGIRGRELSGATVEQWRPGFDGGGDSPALPRSATGAIGEIYQPLPGGVMFFKRIAPVVTEGDRWSYPNIHGDTLVTTDATGAAVTGLLTYSPDGRPLSGAAGNVVGSADYGWLGSHSRPAEDGATIIEMGARPYLPAIGRFLSIDPVEAGTPNDYAYPADPVNGYDLTGESAFSIAGVDVLDCLQWSVAYCIYHTEIDTFVAIRDYAIRSGENVLELNWTTDGCSDRGLVTRSYDIAGCIRHDFGYRNEEAIFGGRLPASAGKAAIDVQLAFDSIEGCLRAGRGRRSCTNHGLTVLSGVAIIGRPVPRKSK